MRLGLIFALTIGLVTTLSAQVEVNGETINKGQVRVDSFNGSFVANLDGDYTIVLQIDYDSKTMNATVINNDTSQITCVPRACTYNN